MSTTGHYPFNDIDAKIIYKSIENEDKFEAIKSNWLTRNKSNINEVENIDIINDLIKSIENIPNQKDWRGITPNGYKEPKTPKYNSIQESAINQFKRYLVEQKDKIENPNPLERLKDFLNSIDVYFSNASNCPEIYFDDLINDFKKVWNNNFLPKHKGMQSINYLKDLSINKNLPKWLIDDTIKQINQINQNIIDARKSEKDANINKNRLVQINNVELIEQFRIFESEFYKIIDLDNSTNVKQLQERKIEQPQQEDETPTETLKENLYNDYFKGNTFLLFKEYCETKEVDNTCRTDLSVLFQLFSEYGFFVDTMELKHYLKFLSKYLKYDSLELKKVDIHSKPNIKRTNDFNRIKSDLKLTLK